MDEATRPGEAARSRTADAEEKREELEEEADEARVWLEGLDRINNCLGDGKPGISMCVDLSATPFYIKGSGYPEGQPFPWLVSDFGLVDAIECGIVKIPRLPVKDDRGRRTRWAGPTRSTSGSGTTSSATSQPSEKLRQRQAQARGRATGRPRGR